MPVALMIGHHFAISAFCKVASACGASAACLEEFPTRDRQGGRSLIQWLIRSCGLTCGTAGPGSPSHVTAMYFQNTIGVRFQLVPYRGTPLVIQDLVAGQVDIVFDSELRCRRCAAERSRRSP